MNDDVNIAQPQSTGPSVNEIAEGYVEDSVALDPTIATYFGIAGHDHELSDLSPEGFAAREQLARRTVAEMAGADPANRREEVAKASFLERLGVELDEYAAGTPQCAISVVSSSMHTMRSVFDLMPTASEEDWATIAARLGRIPDTLADYRTTLLEYADRGEISAKRQLAAVAEQIESWIGVVPGSANLFHELVDRASVRDDLGAELSINADRATGAFAGFAQFLSSEMLPRGRDRDAVGRDAYAVQSRSFLGATVDLDETYDWAWTELHRIEQEMADVSSQIVPGGSLEDAIATLDADPARSIEGGENFRDWMQDLADRTIAELDGTHFDIPEPIRRIECSLAPTHDGGIYYTGPSEDFSRPGRMWWSVPEGVNRFATWQEVTTVYHEGVPGHHLQVADTVYRRDELNRWQRTMCWVSGHGEGWALYAERLMDELGYLEDPGNRLGMLDGQRLRAVRVIVDIGMHLELQIPTDNPFGFAPGETWTPDLGLQFMQEHCRLGDAMMRYEHMRYLGWPGQAPSYKVGERIWFQARDAAQQRAAEAGRIFDLKKFHSDALSLGSIGLDTLRDSLATL